MRALARVYRALFVANVQQAISCYEAALRVHTERDFPQDWALAQTNLGIAWLDLPTGDRAANLRQSIDQAQLIRLPRPEILRAIRPRHDRRLRFRGFDRIGNVG